MTRQQFTAAAVAVLVGTAAGLVFIAALCQIPL